MLAEERNFQLDYIGKLNSRFEPEFDFDNNTTTTTTTTTTTKNQTAVAKKIYNVFRNYHFVGVTERMDESLVVMKLLFDFPDESIVVLDSKRSGGMDDGEWGKCNKIRKAHTTKDVDEYISPGGTYRSTNDDYFLYEVANQSLDKTIERMGRERVEREVLHHRALRRMAEEACYNTTIFPCMEGMAGKKRNRVNDCYISDMGCGHECIIRAIRSAKTSSVGPPQL